MKILRCVLVGLCLVALGACDELSPGSVAPRDRAVRPVPSTSAAPPRADRAARLPSIPARPKVHLGSLAGERAEVKQAIADLKTIGIWSELTKHLYRIDVHVKSGEASVPNDRHLADARFWKQEIAHGTYDYPEGSFCWIRLFPAAMNEDLERWRSYFEQGVLAEPPPTERQFWAAILGHELSHCPRRGENTAPEEVALEWEHRILAALRTHGPE